MTDYKESLQLEDMFLTAAEVGDKKTILAALEKHHIFNVNCVDEENKTALVLAVEAAQTEVVDILANHPAINHGDALLRAVNLNFEIEARVLCESLESRQLLPHGLYCRAINSDFHPYVTPVVLAAQNNHYDILKLLVGEFGAQITDPSSMVDEDESSLEHSVGALHLYRALASEAYITLTSEDPIEFAFKMSKKMKELSIRLFEFRFEFEELAQKAEKFAADLLENVQSTEEQTITLSHKSGHDHNGSSSHTNGRNDSDDLLVPHKIKTAIDYDQKKFVAHSHCQHRLVEMWYRGLPNWRRQSSMKSMMKSTLMMIGFPVLSICYIVAPHRRPGNLLKIPYVKFLCHVASTLTFLILLCVQSFDLQYTLYSMYRHVTSQEGGEEHKSMMSLLNDLFLTPVEIAIIIWVGGYTWSNIREIWTKGIRVIQYNIQGKLYDYFNLFLFWTWAIMRLVVLVEVIINREHKSDIATADNITAQSYNGETCPTIWETQELGCLNSKLDILLQSQEDVQGNITTLILRLEEVIERAEASQATRNSRMKRSPASIMRAQGGQSVVADISIDELHDSRLIQMTLLAEGMIALAKTLCFLSLIRITVVHLQIGPMQISFGRMGEDIFKFLAIFVLVLIAFSVGMHQLYHFSTYVKMMRDCVNAGSTECSDSADSLFKSISALFWTLFGLSDMKAFKTPEDHWFIDILGYILFAGYNLVAIVVLLNILIAMMSNTYTRIEEDADTHWKFSRSCLWISFYESSAALSSPFNLVPTMKSIRNFCFCHNLAAKCLDIQHDDVQSRVNVVDKKELRYNALMKEMGQRYAFSKLKSGEEKKDPLIMQLKRDLTGLRTETKENLDTLGHTMKEIAGEEVEEDDNMLKGVLDEVERVVNSGPVSKDSFRDPLNQTIASNIPYADELSLGSAEGDDPSRRGQLLRPNSKWMTVRANVLPSLKQLHQNSVPLVPRRNSNSRQLPPRSSIRLRNQRRKSSGSYAYDEETRLSTESLQPNSLPNSRPNSVNITTV
ncbi:short transient receptor potential channel 1-like [Glandiceps talaboti]